MSKTYNFITVPASLSASIAELSLKESHTNKAYHLIHVLQNNSMKLFKNQYSSVPLPYNYLREIFDSKFYDFLKPLLEKEIIIRNDSYSTELKKSKEYCINPKFYSNSNLSSPKMYNTSSSYSSSSYTSNNTNKGSSLQYVTTFLNSDLSTVGYKVKNNIPDNRKKEQYQVYVEQDLKSLGVDSNKLKKISIDYISNISLDNFRIDTQILDDVVWVYERKGYFYKDYFCNVHNKLKDLIGTGLSIIQDKRKFYIQNPSEFLEMKRSSLYYSYIGSIVELFKKSYHISRNLTNNRLDHNLTSMCNLISTEIMKDNNLVSIDLNNSQFAIFSHLTKDLAVNDDFRLFQTLSQEGVLYELIQDILGLNDRKEAKTIMFELLFSSHRNHSYLKTLLKNKFPSVVNWVDDFKKKNGDNAFAIMLQRKEAEIFIDGIWMNLKEQGLFCLTKHDSLIVRKEDMSNVLDYVQYYFDSIGFRGKITTT